MEYLIFIAFFCTLLTIYHVYKYAKSNYQKLGYYLDGETWIVVNVVVTFWVFIITISIVVGVVYLGGQFVKLFF